MTAEKLDAKLTAHKEAIMLAVHNMEDDSVIERLIHNGLYAALNLGQQNPDV